MIIPQRNEPDLDDVPEAVLRELQVHPVGDVRDVLDLALQSTEESADQPSRAGETVAAA